MHMLENDIDPLGFLALYKLIRILTCTVSNNILVSVTSMAFKCNEMLYSYKLHIYNIYIYIYIYIYIARNYIQLNLENKK